MTVNDLSNKFPSIPWKEYLNTFLSGITEVQEDDVVNVVDPNFITGLEKLLKTTSSRVLVNYVISNLVQGSIDFTLNEELRNRKLKFDAVLSGIKEFPDRLVIFQKRTLNSYQTLYTYIKSSFSTVIVTIVIATSSSTHV